MAQQILSIIKILTLQIGLTQVPENVGVFKEPMFVIYDEIVLFYRFNRFDDLNLKCELQ